MPLQVYNSYTRQREVFESLIPGHVGMYVCGPTVSGESHLGHARPYITFDVVYRYLTHLGYKVRYVRNITDAGHFEEEGREAEDKISKKAVIEKLEPMELVQKYTNLFHWAMNQFNNIPPSIEPTATGHIVEQIEMIKKIIAAGYAYEVNGSVYFDVKKYASNYPYGKLSGRVIDDLLETTRLLEGQDEKHNKQDFALWKAAPPQHIMRWASPWGEGFPGWHIECSAMSSKYLGKQFDIHGGGMDLLFPHHESEIAQSNICNGGQVCARYWLHNNMITIDGKKMGKSYGNQIMLTDMFSGRHPILAKAYSPMTIRFFILQTQYHSTLDFSNEALIAAEKGLKRLWEAYTWLLAEHGGQLAKDKMEVGSLQLAEQQLAEGSWTVGAGSRDDGTGFAPAQNTGNHEGQITESTAGSNAAVDEKVRKLIASFAESMNDDFNTAKVLASMFEIVPVLNGIKDKHIAADALTAETWQLLSSKMKTYVENILGLKDETEADNETLNGLMQLLISLRKDAKAKKDYATSDAIRKNLQELGVSLKDEKDGNVSYTFN